MAEQNLLLLGDVNLHMDKITTNRSFSDRGLGQTVSVPTHKKGHHLGVVITKEKALFVSDVQVTDLGLCTNHGQLAGDHFAVT